MSRTLLLSASTRALLIPSRIAARMPWRCLRIVAARVTNGSRRLRAALAHQRSSSWVVWLGVRSPAKTSRSASLNWSARHAAPPWRRSLRSVAAWVSDRRSGRSGQHPAGAVERLGLVRVDRAQLVPDLPADLLERVGGQLDDVERVDAHGRLGGVAGRGDRLQEGGSHVGGDGGQLGGSLLAQGSEEPVAGGGVFAFAAPDDLAAAVVGDQRQVAVALADDTSSMPTSNSPSSRPGSSRSATTRWQIAPMVCQATRTSWVTAVLSILVASHATRSSTSRVKPDSGRANGTPSVRTPWVGQSMRRSLAVTTSRKRPRSRCRQEEFTVRVS